MEVIIPEVPCRSPWLKAAAHIPIAGIIPALIAINQLNHYFNEQLVPDERRQILADQLRLIDTTSVLISLQEFYRRAVTAHIFLLISTVALVALGIGTSITLIALIVVVISLLGLIVNGCKGETKFPSSTRP